MNIKSILRGEKAVVLFLLFVLQACSYQNLEKEFPEINEINSGKKFTIILPEKHSENFVWKLSDDRDKHLIEYIGAVWHGNEKGVYYNFKALTGGTDTLHFTQLQLQDTTKTASYIVKVID